LAVELHSQTTIEALMETGFPPLSHEFWLEGNTQILYYFAVHVG